MMICGKCGASLPEMAKFCVMCGNRLDMPVQEQPMKREFNTGYTTGFSTISDKHYSLEEIAQQQTGDLSEMAFPGYDRSAQRPVRNQAPAPAPARAPAYPSAPAQGYPAAPAQNYPSAPAPAQSYPAAPAPVSAPAPAAYGQQPKQKTLVYSLKTPAVPLGEQKQINCSVFAPELAQELELARRERDGNFDY